MTFKNGQPIYVQIADRLADEIMAKKYCADERVPGVREYSVLLEVNVNTTVKAYDLLAMCGIIYNKRGMGYFVSTDAERLIRYTRRYDFFSEFVPEIRRRMRLLGISIEELTKALLAPSGTSETTVGKHPEVSGPGSDRNPHK